MLLLGLSGKYSYGIGGIIKYLSLTKATLLQKRCKVIKKNDIRKCHNQNVGIFFNFLAK